MPSRSELGEVIKSALVGGVEAITPWLDPEVIWGHCHSADLVARQITEMFDAGVEVTSGEVVTLPDRFVVDLTAEVDGESLSASVAIFDDANKIVELHGPTSDENARSVARSGPFTATSDQAAFESVAPVFPVRDVSGAMAHYEALGFTLESYDGGASYAFARRGDVWIHLAHVGDVDPATNMSAVYLYVSDAKSLFAEWRTIVSGPDAGRLHAPTDTDYGLCEGAHVDPDGNLIRFGSPI